MHIHCLVLPDRNEIYRFGFVNVCMKENEMKLDKSGFSCTNRTLHIRRARSFRERFWGLMLTDLLASDHALLIDRCRSVHTCFMRYPIDVVYIGAGDIVVKVVEGLKPWRFSSGGKGALQALELAEGGVKRHNVLVGERLHAAGV